MPNADIDQSNNPEPEASRGRDALRSQQPPAPRGTQTRSWRPGVWLTTLSTAVAVATGMFTLRDQIFPQEAGNAPASIGQYEESIAEVCSELNHAEQARKDTASRHAQRLRRAPTTLAQRNALLDSARQSLTTSEYLLGRFASLEAPRARNAQQRETKVAWSDIVTWLRDYVQRLDAAASRRDVLAALGALPRMRRALAPDYLARAAGLGTLGDGRCRLERQSDIPTLTLPRVQTPSLEQLPATP